MESSSAAAAIDVAGPRIAAWSQRLHDAHPTPPWRVGAAVFVLLTALFVGVELALGRHRLIAGLAPDSPELRNVRLSLLLFATFGFVVFAALHLVRRERESLDALVPHLELSAAEAAALRALPGRLRRPALWRGGLVGVAIALLVPLLVDPARVVYDPRQWDPEMYWHRAMLPVLGWWLGRVIALVVTQSLRMRALVGRLPALDLFDPAPLRPFTSMVSAHALVLAGVTGILALNLLEDRFGAMVGVLAAMNAALAALAVFGPLRGVHDRLRAAKERALAMCRTELSEATARLERGAGIARSGRIADLVAYETRVERVAEWPFDAGSLRRLGFYLLIPLLSWSGGALVERLIDTLLD